MNQSVGAPSAEAGLPPATASLVARAARVMASRQSNVRALPEPSIFVERGLGQRVWDVDGREFLDYAIAMGPGIWGHGHREYLDAIHAQVERLLYVQSGACQSELEVELAERVVKHVPCAEHVRFHLSGSEAVQMTIRLARAFTGRQKFVRFAGHYHGWLDNVLGGMMNTDPSVPPHAVQGEADPFYSEGKAERAAGESYLVPWNDIDALRRVLREYGDDIALVMMEIYNSNGGACAPRPGYLEQAQQACREHGVLLCFDEIITGFRTALGGAQSLVGVTPDLAIYGKAIAGGMPLAAIAGRKDIFDLFRRNRVIGAGTFNAFPVGMAAGLATLRLLERDNGAVYRQRDRVQARLVEGLKREARDAGHPLLIQEMPGNFCTHFTSASVCWTSTELAQCSDAQKAFSFRRLLRENGIIQGIGNRWFVTFSLSEDDADDTVQRAGRAFRAL